MWFYAAGFGLFTIPVAIYLQQRGRLPSFFNLFDMYGGPWSAGLLDDAFVLRLMAFLFVTGVVGWAAWLLWNGSKVGAVLSLALLPVEAIFWVGFALPFPWLLGAVRVVFIVLGWKALATPRERDLPPAR
jgi:hypothetical protein